MSTNNYHCKCRGGCVCPPPPKPRIVYKELDAETFNRKANAIARSFCPEIYECKKCGNPCVDGYCCMSCGDGCPRLSEEQEKEQEKRYAEQNKR